MKAYLSHGMGVDSTALMLLLEDKGIKFESIFVDHGGDYPETYEYLEYLQGKGFEITVIKPEVEGCNTIEEYCLKHQIVPSVHFRWCTDKFKLKPFKNYVETPCVCFIGIDSEEENRAYQSPPGEGIFNSYPLTTRDLDRGDCKSIIESHGLKIPKRSGCWFCPFRPESEVRELKENYPDLYARRKKIEERASERYGEDLPLNSRKMTREIGMDDNTRISDFEE